MTCGWIIVVIVVEPKKMLYMFIVFFPDIYKVVPQFVNAKLVNITPIKPMVYGRYDTIVNGVYKPTYNWGAPPCKLLFSFPSFCSTHTYIIRITHIFYTVYEARVLNHRTLWLSWMCCLWRLMDKFGEPSTFLLGV